MIRSIECRAKHMDGNGISRRMFVAAGLASASRPLGAMHRPVSHGLDALLDGTGFVRIRAGSFVMGSAQAGEDEAPPHQVRISRAFDMSRAEVTQSQWQAVVTDPHAGRGAELVNAQGSPVSNTPSHSTGPTLPVESVSWYDIELFLRRLNARDVRHTYRLPTEAEWEYASRAGSGQIRPLNIERTAWYKGNSREQSQPVGQKEPNAWGLYDMNGNVAEWVQDWYSPDYYERSPNTDPQGPQTGSYRIFRGGSWIDEAKYCTPTHRRFDLPVNRLSYVGFRLVRVSR
jgi:formylglycine-generating enzyme required for sulfatase activity